MVSALRHAYRAGELPGLTCPGEVDRTLDALMATEWVVYSRATCTQSDTVLSYLARYTHRIALGDSRIRAVTDQTVTFAYKQYAQGGGLSEMTLAGEEFVRRWLLHVLPHGLMRIRHYGFLANACRRKHLTAIRQCLAQDEVAPPGNPATPASDRPPEVNRRYWPPQCPCCRTPMTIFAPVKPNDGRTPVA